MSGKHDKSVDDEQSSNLLLTGPVVIRGLGRGVKDVLVRSSPSRHRAFADDSAHEVEPAPEQQVIATEADSAEHAAGREVAGTGATLPSSTGSVRPDDEEPRADHLDVEAVAALPVEEAGDALAALPQAQFGEAAESSVPFGTRTIPFEKAAVDDDDRAAQDTASDESRASPPIGTDGPTGDAVVSESEHGSPPGSMMIITEIPVFDDASDPGVDGGEITVPEVTDHPSDPESGFEAERVPEPGSIDPSVRAATDDRASDHERVRQAPNPLQDADAVEGARAVAVLASEVSPEPGSTPLDDAAATREQGEGGRIAGERDHAVEEGESDAPARAEAPAPSRETEVEPPTGPAPGVEQVSRETRQRGPGSADAGSTEGHASEDDVAEDRDGGPSQHDAAEVHAVDRHASVPGAGVLEEGRAVQPVAPDAVAVSAAGPGPWTSAEQLFSLPPRTDRHDRVTPASVDAESPGQVDRDESSEQFAGLESESEPESSSEREPLPESASEPVDARPPETEPAAERGPRSFAVPDLAQESTRESGSEQVQQPVASPPPAAAATVSPAAAPRSPRPGPSVQPWSRAGRPRRELLGRETIGIAVLVILALACAGLVAAVAVKTRSDAVIAAREAANYTPPPLATNDPVVAVIGDGSTSTTGSGVIDSQRWTALLESSLGATVDVDASSGSGYVAKGGSGRTFVQAASAVPSNARIVVFFGGAADSKNSSVALARAATAAYAAVTEQAPDAKILVVGPAVSSGVGTADLTRVRGILRSAAALAGATWIDPIDEEWLPTSEQSVAPTDLSASDEKAIASGMQDAVEKALP